MDKLMLIRFNSKEKQTLGKLLFFNETGLVFSCYTLELAWKNNETSVSCIPTGEYIISPRTAEESASFKYDHFEVKDVPDRKYILIHAGNYYSQIRGCILVGDSLSDINSDGELDVRNSKTTLNLLTTLIKSDTILKIINL